MNLFKNYVYLILCLFFYCSMYFCKYLQLEVTKTLRRKAVAITKGTFKKIIFTPRLGVLVFLYFFFWPDKQSQVKQHRSGVHYQESLRKNLPEKQEGIKQDVVCTVANHCNQRGVKRIFIEGPILSSFINASRFHRLIYLFLDYYTGLQRTHHQIHESKSQIIWNMLLI